MESVEAFTPEGSHTSWMQPYLRAGAEDVSEEGVGRTVATRVTQDPDSRFPVTMLTQTRL